MVAKDIIKLVCTILEKEDLANCDELKKTSTYMGIGQNVISEIIDGVIVGEIVNPNVTIDESQQKEIIRLVNCLNLILDEIACDYFPLLKTESIIPEDNYKINIASLSKDLLKIYKLTNKYGKNIAYKLFPEYIYCPCSFAEITYSYKPEKVNLLTDLKEFSFLSERTIAYGVITEYLILCGQYDEASFWEKRYKDSLLSTYRKRSDIIVKSRRWV